MLTPSLVSGRDYAVAGAQTGPTAIEPVTNLPADLLGQVSLYGSTHRSSTPRPGTLYAFDIGGNDIMSALNKYGANVPAVNNVVVAAETNTVDAIKSLYALGARNILFYEVPDLGLTPRFYNTALQGYASFYAKWFDNTLLSDSRLSPYKQYGGLKVFDLDTYDLLDAANTTARPSASPTSPTRAGPAALPAQLREVSAPRRIRICSGTLCIRP
jgi:outer membrane lipase/esterase